MEQAKRESGIYWTSEEPEGKHDLKALLQTTTTTATIATAAADTERRLSTKADGTNPVLSLPTIRAQKERMPPTPSIWVLRRRFRSKYPGIRRTEALDEQDMIYRATTPEEWGNSKRQDQWQPEGNRQSLCLARGRSKPVCYLG